MAPYPMPLPLMEPMIGSTRVAAELVLSSVVMKEGDKHVHLESGPVLEQGKGYTRDAKSKCYYELYVSLESK